MPGDGTILVVDDEQTCREIYRNWLSGAHEVRTACDGHQALAKLDESVDVVLLDRRMTGPSGERIASEIIEQPTNCRVVMVTAVSPDVDIVGMDIDDYLTKPVTGEKLRETVERMLARSVYRQEMQQFYALASKKATLEAERSASELLASEEYVELERRMETTRDRLYEALLASEGDWTDKFRACTETSGPGAVA